MEEQKKSWTSYLLPCGIGAIIGFICGVIFIGLQLQKATGNAEEAIKFSYALKMLRRNFVGELDDKKLYRGAISGMLKATGDPYTVFLDEKDFQALDEMRTGGFGGIGVVFGKRGDDYIIISVLDDNPGAKVGVKAGEKIVEIDGKPTRDMHTDEVAYSIRGEVGTIVELTLSDKKGVERKVKITRAMIKAPTVLGKAVDGTKGKIGYIRIGQFNENTYADFRSELDKLSKHGMQALILDLRYNPGGLMDQAVKVCQELVPKGPVVSTIAKDGTSHVEYSRLEKVRWPLAVLVNEGSASASEIVAGAVKDTKSGVLVGEKTFGKGSVQAVYPLGDANTGMKITVAKYYTPSGVCINEIGIEPDIKVLMDEKSTSDLQLEKAKQYLLEKIKR